MKTEDKRTSALNYPVLVSADRSHKNSHLVADIHDRKTVCGVDTWKFNKSPTHVFGGDVTKCECKKCVDLFWEKFDSIKTGGHNIYCRTEYLTYKKFFAFCKEPPFVKQVRCKELLVGDIVYMETEGKLEVGENGEFLYVVLSRPEVVSVNKNFEPNNWCVHVNTLSEFRKTFNSAIKIK